MTYHLYLRHEDYDPLPDSVKRYIMELETRCDPAGDIQTIASLTDQRDALLKYLDELKAVLHDIMMTGMTMPFETHSCAESERDFYLSQLKSCIGRAARALEGNR